jgi:DNA (cytosine-5)-methyltransferase 1
VDNTEEFGISFCTGYGGLERGLKLAGVKHRIIAHVEIEAYAVANLVAKMEQGLMVPAPVWTNLKTFPLDKFRGCVDFITAGYPCQPFSCAGQRKGTDDTRHLWPYIRRAVNVLQPRWCFLENVEGHVTLGLSTVISDLEEDGYSVKAGLFTAAEVGAPHRRKRVFILGNSRRFSEGDKGARPCGREVSDKTGIRATERYRSSDSSKMANYNSINRSAETEERNDDGQAGSSSEVMPERTNQWPSGPGSPQYDWEEPRVS